MHLVPVRTRSLSVWPDPQYPPVTCVGCGKTVPELDASWGYCGECWASNRLVIGIGHIEADPDRHVIGQISQEEQ